MEQVQELGTVHATVKQDGTSPSYQKLTPTDLAENFFEHCLETLLLCSHPTGRVLSLSSCRPTKFLRDVSTYPTVTTLQVEYSPCRPVVLPSSYVTCRPTLQSLPYRSSTLLVVLSSYQVPT